MKKSKWLTLAALAALAACDSGVPTEPAGTPGITFLAGTNATDTIDAELTQMLRVEVRQADGKLAARTEVRAEALGTRVAEVLPGLPGKPFTDAVRDTTDARGIVEIRVKLGTQAGPARLLVSAPALQMSDTARYTVLPGAPARVRTLPVDTAVTIGKTVSLRVSVADRAGNPRTDAVTYTTAGTGGTVSDGTITTSAFGRLLAIATVGGRSDTTYVSAVPQATIAGVVPGGYSAYPGIYLAELDGSNPREVRRGLMSPGSASDMKVGWLGSGKLVFHDASNPPNWWLYVADVATGATARFLPPADRLATEYFPRVSGDGSWVYFSGGTFAYWDLYRARADGTGRELIAAGGTGAKWQPTPSPDGTRVAYVSFGPGSTGYHLDVITLATREVSRLASDVSVPRWSPDGTRIAYLARPSQYSGNTGVLSVIGADGGGARRLTQSTTPLIGDIDWSPDGKYLIGSYTDGRTVVVEAATGIEAPVTILTPGGYLGSPVWRP